MRAASTRGASNLRLALLVIEGYAYLLGTIFIFAGVVAFFAWGTMDRRPIIGLLAAFVGVPTALATGGAIRALFFRLPEPDGIGVTAAEAPALIALVEEVRRALGCRRIHRVVIGAALNASAVQTPRCAIFWPRNMLVIGYPLLLALSCEQLRAVVAHELAHVFHAHGSMGGWVYRTRLSWRRLSEALSRRGMTPIFVQWCLAHYVPRLEVVSAEIARRQEALADRLSAELAGGRNAADALLAIELRRKFLDETFWPSLLDRIGLEAEPPGPHARMREAFARPREEDDAPAPLIGMLGPSTGPYDTHPPLGERLRAMGEEPRIPPRPLPSAATVCLDAFEEVVVARLDADWRREHGAEWRQRHASTRAALSRLSMLDARSSRSADEEVERGRLLEELDREDEALSAYRAALRMGPHGRASLAAGRILLERGDPEGAALAEAAMQADPALDAEACDLLARHYRDQGRLVDAERYRARSARLATQSALARTERSTVTALDQLAPHELDLERLGRLVAALRSNSRVAQAFLARKRLRHSGESLFVLGIVPVGEGAAEARDLIKPDALPCPDSCVVMLNRHQRALQSALEAVPDARIC